MQFFFILIIHYAPLFVFRKMPLGFWQLQKDFMFGTKEMDIDGITEDGKVIPVFRKGNFVF